MYNATLYFNTGFNAVNIPDSPQTLNNARSAVFPAIDIYQARELSTFIIKANYADVRDADYLYLQNTSDANDFAYYSIQNITMTSMDTAVLHVTMDYILTAGGVANLTFTDGMCERHHVASADDTFGKYDESDPYLTPAEMLQIETVAPDFKGADSDKAMTIVESTLDLYGMYVDANETGGKPVSIDYTSKDAEVVTVPMVRPYEKGISGVKAFMEKATSPYYETQLPQVNFVIPYADQAPLTTPDQEWSLQIDSHHFGDAFSYVRSLGVESCIIAQYAVPFFMIKDTTFEQWSGTVSGSGAALTAQCGQVENLYGTYKLVSLSTLPFIKTYNNYTVRNKRVFYGDNCKYNIVSIASGNSAEFLPEEIFDYSAQTTPLNPSIEMRVDPRPEGCPYFRFNVYRNDKTEDMFFINAVKGLNWQNVPLVYQGGSGSLINQYKFNAQQQMLHENANYQYQSAQLQNIRDNYRAAGNIAGDVLGGAGSLLTGDVSGAISAAATAATRAVDMQFVQQAFNMSQEHAQNSYNIQRNAELQNLLIQNNVVAPSMNFPISEGIRDYVGNTCLVYRTYYSDNDVRRIDKILTMYGYRHTTPITTALLTNRSKFNYVQASGVSVGNATLPKWIRDGIAMQFATGTRIWHQLPDINAYTDGTNV